MNVINKRLSLSKKIRFGVGDFGLSVFTACLQFYMLFYYTDVVGIDSAVAGTAILVGKITWDMINDGLFGYIIDKTKSRWGRRRPYLLFGTVPMALAFWLLLSLPEGMSNAMAFLAILGTFILFDTFNTLVGTAYSTMTAELTMDYDERTNLATTRMIFNVVGYIFGAAVTTMLALYIHENFGASMRTAWSFVGLAFGILATISLMITALSKDLKPVVNDNPSKMPPLSALFSTFKNKPFVKFFTISSIMSTAFTMVTTMLPYFIIYQMNMETSQGLIMVLLLVTLAIFLIPCKIMTDKIGKAKTYALGIGIASFALFTGFFLPHQASPIIFAVAIVAGLGFSAQWVSPHSMMPDVIEYDELLTGERREGIYYGVWGMTGKVTGALGVAICGWGLKLVGYVQDVEQSALSLLGIRLMFTVIPIVLLIICIPLLIRYPINKKTHAEIVKQLNQKRIAQMEAAGGK